MWNGSQIHSKHVTGVWQPSYAVDGDMDPSPWHYHHTCWSRYAILGHCLVLVLTEGFVQWFQTHVEWFLHPLQIYERSLAPSYAVDGDMDPSSCHITTFAGPNLRSQVKSRVTA